MRSGKILGRLARCLSALPAIAFGAACFEGPGQAGDDEHLLERPAYAAVTLGGDTVSLASLRGSPVLLNLWATWCPPCREEMPSLQRVHQDYGPQGLRVVAVSTDRADAGLAVERFVEDRGINFTILHDPDDRAGDVFRTFGLPETFLFDREGRMVRRWRGKVDGDSREFRKALERVLD